MILNPRHSPEYTDMHPVFNDMGAYALNPDHYLNKLLLRWYMLNEGGGARAFDFVTRNQAAWTGTPAWVGGPRGMGAAFSPSATSYVTIANPPPLPLSISYWVKENSRATSMVHFNMYTTGSQGISFGYNTGQLKYLSSTPTPNFRGCEAASLPLGQWNHVTICFVSTTAVITVYCNGVNKTSTTTTEWATRTISTIGARGPATQSYLNGSISDFQIFRGILTPEQVWDLYQNPYGTPHVPRLIFPQRVIFTPAVVSGTSGTITLPGVTSQPTNAPVTLSGVQQGIITMSGVSAKPVIAPAVLTGVMYGTITLPGASAKPVVVPVTLEVVNATNGEFIMRSVGFSSGAAAYRMRYPNGQIVSYRPV